MHPRQKHLVSEMNYQSFMKNYNEWVDDVRHASSKYLIRLGREQKERKVHFTMKSFVLVSPLPCELVIVFEREK